MWFMWSLTSCLKDARGWELKIETSWGKILVSAWGWLTTLNQPIGDSLSRRRRVSILSGDQLYRGSRTINYQTGCSIIAVVLKEWPARCPILGPDSCNLSESLLWGNNINLAINNGRLSDGSYHCDLNEDWRRHMIKLLSKWGVQQVIW